MQRKKLKNGQFISQKEYRQLVSRVNRVNEMRDKFIESLDTVTKASYLFDKEKGGNFIPAKKSAKLSRFRNRKEFLTYNRNLARILDTGVGKIVRGGKRKIVRTDYFDRKIDIYRSNLNRAIKKVFNSAGDDLRKFVNKLSNDELRELTMKEQFEDIGFVYYDNKKASAKLQELTEQVEKIRARKRKG